jgi:hypothetical protein
MTSRILFIIGMIMLCLTISQNPVQAKMIRGEVTAVNDNGQSFSFKRTKPSNPAVIERFDIDVLPATKFERINSLKELAAGDEVVVDASKRKEDGIWEARGVRILKVQLH